MSKEFTKEDNNARFSRPPSSSMLAVPPGRSGSPPHVLINHPPSARRRSSSGAAAERHGDVSDDNLADVPSVSEYRRVLPFCVRDSRMQKETEGRSIVREMVK